MNRMSPELAQSLQKILDMATGADGGVGYVKLREALTQFEAEKSEAGDKLVELVHSFARLIRVCEEGPW